MALTLQDADREMREGAKAEAEAAARKLKEEQTMQLASSIAGPLAKLAGPGKQDAIDGAAMMIARYAGSVDAQFVQEQLKGIVPDKMVGMVAGNIMQQVEQSQKPAVAAPAMTQKAVAPAVSTPKLGH